MWIHLNPVGGIAGDMFISSVLDAFPELASDMLADLKSLGAPAEVFFKLEAYKHHGIGGSKFHVSSPTKLYLGENCPGSFVDIITFIDRSSLNNRVKEIATQIFRFIAEAESHVHKIDIESISFHELGEWDSIIDVVGASILINNLNAGWTVDRIPMGRGTVDTQHGKLPVPAPATSFLLEGFDVYDDGVVGERVTPTGAAILKYLCEFHPVVKREGNLRFSGIGFGTQVFKEFSNVLRVLVFSQVKSSVAQSEKIGKIEFEVDDQTPEHLAIAIEKLRSLSGVLDVMQIPGIGKKNRFATSIHIICIPEQVREVIEVCFRETTTIGVRFQKMDRLSLSRKIDTVETKEGIFRVKLVERDGELTGKVEADDLRIVDGGQNGRELSVNKALGSALKKKY
ncbi:MAG: hypothetical protein CMK56_03610 [Proteobacteria bacterium]|nr:hypothetical protein [Pseudomonadota bacterium]